MVKLVINHIKEGAQNRPGYLMEPKGLLFHTTNNWNKGADDTNHVKYLANKSTTASWHETVDSDSCTQHLPHNENGWHAGDGPKGHYNRNWLGMEIACNNVAMGKPLDKATYENAVQRAAEICKMHNFGWADLQPHNVVYGKDCPHHTLFNRDQFKKDVFARVAKLGVTKPTKPTTAKGDGYLHIVKAGDTMSEIAATYKTSVDFLARLNGLSNPGMIFPGQRIKLKGDAPAPKPVSSNPGHPAKEDGIKVVGKIKITGVAKAAIICDKPSSTNSKDIALAPLNSKYNISGSVGSTPGAPRGWYEVIYKGKRRYINAKFATLQ